jgi:hypothetical protein
METACRTVSTFPKNASTSRYVKTPCIVSIKANTTALRKSISTMLKTQKSDNLQKQKVDAVIDVHKSMVAVKKIWDSFKPDEQNLPNSLDSIAARMAFFDEVAAPILSALEMCESSLKISESQSSVAIHCCLGFPCMNCGMTYGSIILLYILRNITSKWHTRL